MIIIAGTFCQMEFLKSPRTEGLFTIQIKIIPIMGSNSPLATCANCMITIGLIPKESEITPIKSTIIQTVLNRASVTLVFHPKQLLAT